MKRLFIIVLLFPLFAFAQDAIDGFDSEVKIEESMTIDSLHIGTILPKDGTTMSIGDTLYSGGYQIADGMRLGRSVFDSLGRVLIYVQNKTGTALAEGDAVVWDNASIEVIAKEIIADTALVIADTLNGEGGYLTLSVIVDGTPDAGDSIYVYGTTYEGGSGDFASTLMPASADPTFMVLDTTSARILHWSTIDSIKFNADAYTDGADSVTVNAYGVATVKASDGANTDIAGVAIGAISDNAFNYICTHGVCKATVDAGTNSASPGVLLEGAANGDLVTDAAATASKNIGRCLEYSTEDNKKILVFIDCM